MLKISLIRHGKTYGNTLGRYIGTTDEPLLPDSIRLLQSCQYPAAESIYVSPLRRCIETADLIYQGRQVHIIEELAECDFGEFENKNYQELADDSRYQEWIDSNGTLPFPGGERPEAFQKRCVKGFQKVVSDCIRSGKTAAAIVAHGGTIMAILDEYAIPHKDFYHWQVKNGRGFVIEVDPSRWKANRQEVIVIDRITMASTRGRN